MEPSARSPTLVRYGLAGLLAVGAALIVAVVVASRGGTSFPDVAGKLRAAGCTLRIVRADDPGRFHLASLKAKVRYNTFPPTNGRHYVWWAPWALYRVPVSPLQTVHNLEHGGIVLQYGDRVSRSSVADTRDFYFRDRNAMLMAPLPKLGAKIALAAWTAAPPRGERTKGNFGQGHLALCPRFDDEAFSAFRDAYRYHGLESPDPQLLEPGL